MIQEDTALNIQDTEVKKKRKSKASNEVKTIQETPIEPALPEIEEVMPIEPVDEKTKDDMFHIGDEVEVVGLPECRQYMMIGKITKILDNHTYAVNGTSHHINKRVIGHNGVLVRSFKAINLRKIKIITK